jgi:hypothetical protein
MEPKPVRDDPGAQATLREAQERRVPDDLVRQLHDATGRADGLRRELDVTLGDAEYGKAERAGQIGEALRAAERHIEEVSQQIHDATPPEATGAANPGT